MTETPSAEAALMQEIGSSKGMAYLNRAHMRSFSLNIFQMNAKELLDALALSKREEVIVALMNQANQGGRHQVEREVIRLFHNFVMGARTLDRHTTLFVDDFYSEGPVNAAYKARRQADLAKNPLAHFVRGLRSYFMQRGLVALEFHVILTPAHDAPPALEGVGIPMTAEGDLQLRVDELLKWEGWKKYAKQYLESAGERVTLRDLTQHYVGLIDTFQNALDRDLEEHHREDLVSLQAKQQEFTPQPQSPTSHSGSTAESENAGEAEKAAIPTPPAKPANAIKLNPELATWIDQQVEKLVALIEDHSERARQQAPRVPMHPDHPTPITINDIIGEPLHWQTIPGGKRVGFFFRHKDQTFGLIDDALGDALKIAEKIWQRKDLVDKVSTETIETLLLSTARDRFRGQQTKTLSVKVEDVLNAASAELTVLVPLEWMALEQDFHFGEGTFVNLTKDELDFGIGQARGDVPLDEKAGQFRQNVHQKYAGRPALRFLIAAEEERAQEIAVQRARDYMALLQFFCAPAMIPNLVSLVAPAGRQPPQTIHVIHFGPGTCGLAERVADEPWRLELTRSYLQEAGRLGLGHLSELAKGTKTPYERDLLQSLLVYGRACYQHDHADKLLQIMTALEMFALKSQSEAIQFAVADRLAFSINSDADKRQAAVDNFRTVYGLRSKRAHHGQSLSELDQIGIFLQNVWSFFLVALNGRGKFQERMDFLTDLDRKKYGGTPAT